MPVARCELSELHPGLRISQMQQAMAQAFADVYGLPVTTITESQLDASEIEARRMRFASYDWIYGRAQPFPFSCGARYPWGEITLELQVEEGVCRDAAVYTDSMDAEFAAPLARPCAAAASAWRTCAAAWREVPACSQIRGRPCAPCSAKQEILKGAAYGRLSTHRHRRGPGGYTAALARREAWPA